MSRQVVFPDQRYARLLVLTEDGMVNRHRAFLCRCDCGETTRVSGAKLRNGHTRSCGCLQDEHRRAQASAAAQKARLVTPTSNRTHGHYVSNRATPTYVSWQAMKRRCLNPKSDQWEHYGGRGIAVCQRWRDSFDAFLADMGERPDGKTIDRIDNDGNYEPANCRWATASEQMLNRPSVWATRRARYGPSGRP